jgi:hypothetical protein
MSGSPASVTVVRDFLVPERVAPPLSWRPGSNTRFRLNRGGDGKLNKASYTIALIRMNKDPATRDYVAKRASQGKTNKGNHPKPQEIHHPADLPDPDEAQEALLPAT